MKTFDLLKRARPALMAAATGMAMLGGLSACGTVQRSVTHISTWSGAGGDYFYVAFAEDALTSHVKHCKIHEDNTVTCVDEPQLDALLNEPNMR